MKRIARVCAALGGIHAIMLGFATGEMEIRRVVDERF